jgi:hypothetical protein
MDYSLFGFKFNVLNALIFLIVGFLIATLTVCSCSRVKSLGDAMKVLKGEKLGDKKESKDNN